MIKKSKETSAEIEICRITRGIIKVRVCGLSPLIMNRLSEKAKHELMMPAKRKNTAERASSLKHNPLEEFRASANKSSEQFGPLLCVPSGAFKGAMSAAALDIPGATKTQIGRLVYVPGMWIQVFGIPEVFCAIVRSADINKTPDVRTRAILREWCAEFDIHFMTPNLSEKSVLNLLAASGEICGIGDWRPGKGSGSFGRFELVDGTDKRYDRIVKQGGREAQIAALENPSFYDAESAELCEWFDEELVRRGRVTDVSTVPTDKKTKRATAADSLN